MTPCSSVGAARATGCKPRHDGAATLHGQRHRHNRLLALPNVLHKLNTLLAARPAVELLPRFDTATATMVMARYQLTDGN
ncbi:hypothetical protein SAVIM40S_07732 [Streptomyces avidinii]